MRPSSFGASFTFTAFTKGKIKADGTNYQSEHANDHYCLKEGHNTSPGWSRGLFIYGELAPRLFQLLAAPRKTQPRLLYLGFGIAHLLAKRTPR
jgi:hypothetical protein